MGERVVDPRGTECGISSGYAERRAETLGWRHGNSRRRRRCDGQDGHARVPAHRRERATSNSRARLSSGRLARRRSTTPTSCSTSPCPRCRPEVVDAALTRGIPMLVGTSGWTAERIAAVGKRVAAAPRARGRHRAQLLPRLGARDPVRRTRRALLRVDRDRRSPPPGKVDSPSGTAIRTAELIGAARAEHGPSRLRTPTSAPAGSRSRACRSTASGSTGCSLEQEVCSAASARPCRIRHVTMSDASYEAGILLGLRADPRGPRTRRRSRRPARPRRCHVKVRAGGRRHGGAARALPALRDLLRAAADRHRRAGRDRDRRRAARAAGDRASGA